MGPLHGLKIVEFAGIGPAPFAGMMLSDLGAEVVQIDRAATPNAAPAKLFAPDKDIANRGRRALRLDLKTPDGAAAALRLIERADALIEGFRPGVMERLGLGPEVCLARNPRLIYGRMTGWGQTGPLAPTSGHDIDYLALSGVLHAIGRADSGPPPPLNTVADHGGGGMLLVVGLLAALLESRNSGQGQVVDAAMIDGSALLLVSILTLKAMGCWTDRRESNLLDGGAHFYDTYECADGKWLAVGAIEPHFYRILLEGCGVTDPAPEKQWHPESWPALKERLRAAFRTRSRDEWCALFEGSDACVAPVLDLDEAPAHPHNRARQTFVESAGLMQPAPAPRFSRTPAAIQGPPNQRADPSGDWLADWGFSETEIARFVSAGAS
ncbi:MAG: CaiB/BaiF CoA-transferase family protein [Candidatus Contendobacter sp.]|nr:CaiB/BaiF CoA-transferase family protein [Candidatus Contendobacter sp.]MDG4558017.1 CaiB/BaiF CoA-transferase family protein [Candidatus Contendobacter sp.]